MSKITRRRFVTQAAAAFAIARGARVAKAAANDRVALCVIGVRGRGTALARNFAALPDAQITHICDVNEPLLGPFAKQIAEIQRTEPKPVRDLRRVLEDK